MLRVKNWFVETNTSSTRDLLNVDYRRVRFCIAGQRLVTNNFTRGIKFKRIGPLTSLRIISILLRKKNQLKVLDYSFIIIHIFNLVHIEYFECDTGCRVKISIFTNAFIESFRNCSTTWFSTLINSVYQMSINSDIVWWNATAIINNRQFLSRKHFRLFLFNLTCRYICCYQVV